MSRERPPSEIGSDETFISRWSRKKTAAKSATPEATASEALPAAAPMASNLQAGTEPAPTPAPLPPVESLTPESDFTPFMGQGVDESLKRRALKTLFQDPRFNVMDGLDVYIDDYSKPDPLPEGWLEKMNQVARLGEYREPVPEAESDVATQADTEADVAADDVSPKSVSSDLEAMPPVDTAAPEPPPPDVPES